MINYALTTNARVKARIEITVSTLDTVIDTMIASVTDFIEQQCGGRRFKETTYTNEVYDGSIVGVNPQPLPYLILKNAPIASISAFEYRNGTRTSPVWTAFQDDNYEPMNSRGIVKVDLPAGYQNIRVSYVAGYKIDFTDEDNVAVHTLPFELSDLAERLVIKRIKRRESEGKSQETLGQSTIAWGAFLEDADKDIITRYKRVVIA